MLPSVAARPAPERRPLPMDPRSSAPPSPFAGLDVTVLRDLIEIVPMPMMLLDDGRRVLRANRAMCDLLGYSEQELRALPRAAALLHPDEGGDGIRASGALEDGASRPFRQRVIRKDGEVILVEGSVTSIVTPDGGFVVVEHRDVSERVASRAALEVSEARFRSVVETARSGYVMLDADGTMSFANSRFAKMFGYDPEELAGASSTILLPPDEVEVVTARRLARLRGETLATEYRARRLRKDGTEITVDIAASVLGLPGGPDRILAEMRDVTAEVEAQRALATSEARYRQLVDSARNAIITTDTSGRCVIWNQALRELTGYRDEELARMGADDLAADRMRPRVAQRPGGSPSGAPDEPPRSYETAIVTRDGSSIPVIMSVTSLHEDGEPSGSLIELVDLRDQLALRDQLIEARKSEALSTLVAGVAHDFNNLLTAIGGSVEMAANTAGDSRWLSNARQATERAADLVRQLRQFSRRERAAREPVDLARVASTAVDLALQGLDARIRLDLEVPAGLPPVRGDHGQLQQLLMNLLINSRDALDERLEQPLDDAYVPFVAVRMAAESAGSLDGEVRRVVVHVTDNGTGMPPEVRARIFDPFFTTKEVGKGTGLGLATAYSIARDHGGTLEVRSESGSGTEFMLSLPVADDLTPPTGALPSTSMPRGMRVVVVDRDAIVRDTARAILSADGYEALATERASGALELLHVWSAGADVVVLEDTGPASPARWETLERLRTEAPEAPVILASVYATETQALDQGASVLLRKPYTAQSLLAAVTRAAAPPLD
ncbi:MAG: PAS domain S-box protein [Dehalococcoidia bacterium]|nr:PAS domain S-box protein [Dehalococcoidia bacterium]